MTIKMRIEKPDRRLPDFYEFFDNQMDDVRHWRFHHLSLNHTVFWWSEARQEWVDTYEEAMGLRTPKNTWGLPDLVTLAIDEWIERCLPDTLWPHRVCLARSLGSDYDLMADAMRDILAVFQDGPVVQEEHLAVRGFDPMRRMRIAKIAAWEPDVIVKAVNGRLPDGLEAHPIVRRDIHVQAGWRLSDAIITDTESVKHILEYARLGVLLDGSAVNEPDVSPAPPGAPWGIP